MPVPPRAPASGGIATLLPPECTNTASDFRRALRRNRRQLIRFSVVDDATADELEDTCMMDSLALPTPCPLDLPLPAVARIVHYFSTATSWSSIWDAAMAWPKILSRCRRAQIQRGGTIFLLAPLILIFPHFHHRPQTTLPLYTCSNGLQSYSQARHAQ